VNPGGPATDGTSRVFDRVLDVHDLPNNVRVGDRTVITGEQSFKRFHSAIEPVALTVGAGCTIDGVSFALGPEARMTVGDNCYVTSAVLLCELEVLIGSCVLIGWNATIADTDFHPIAPAQRIDDAIACSPASDGRARPAMVRRPVIIEDDVWIGPAATILKGVRIGAGAFIEPGSVVSSDVPSRARVIGNPAQVVGRV
jgi:acetyltransferase-like isoleucine patch superfamily enzyme